MDLTLGNDGSMDKVEVLLLVLLDQALCNFQAGHIFLGWLGLGIHGLVICGSLRLWMVLVSSSLVSVFSWLITPSILSLSCMKLPFKPNMYSLACLSVPGFLHHFSVHFSCCFIDFSWFLSLVPYPSFVLFNLIHLSSLWFFSNSVNLFYFCSSCIFLASVIPV